MNQETGHEVKSMVAEHVSALRKQVVLTGTFSGPCPEDWAVGQEIARQFPAVALAAATEMLTGSGCQYQSEGEDEFWGTGTRRGSVLTTWVRSAYAVNNDPLPHVRDMFPDSDEWGYAPCEGAVPKGAKSLWIGGLASIWRRRG
jgi:hypothetical protein